MSKTIICTCITLFCTFLCRHFTTTAWNYLKRRFVKDVDTRLQISFSLSKHGRWCHQEISSRISLTFEDLTRVGIIETKFEKKNDKVLSMVTLGTLTSNDTTATRMNLRSFSLHSGYFYPRALSNVDGPSWSWISSDHIQAQKEEYNFVVASLRPSKNEKLGIFTSQSCISGKEIYKKGMMHVQSCCFAF